jgi:Mn2+/Fe2+ NRAMP family transporter
MKSRLALIGPGLLVAATGVGAGDLATAAFSGDKLGLAVLWAVVLGALFKFIVNEGLARWQLATGETILEASLTRFGPLVRILFGLYMALWSFFVGAALMSACGVVLQTAFPVFATPSTGKVVFGALSSLAGLGLVLAGGYRLFESVMRVSIGLMFVTVLLTAGLLLEDGGALAQGLLLPSIPDAGGQGLAWTVALVGGVGGTLTILCYSYWIREEGRKGPEALGACRLDLAVGYTVTALFGIAMVVIGNAVTIDAKGINLVVGIADELGGRLGAWAWWVFLVGAFGAVFSSLLGVWQGVPSIFSDYWARVAKQHDAPATRAKSYRVWLLALAFAPMLGLFTSFKNVQKLYAIIGALFVPMLAVALLVLTTRRASMGALRSGWLAQAGLVLVLAFFGYVGFFA